MAGKRQKPLPGFEEYLGKSNASLRFPQPRIDGYQPPNWYDILYHPLDINYKGRLRAWIEHSQSQEGYTLEEILPEYYLKLIKLYLFDDKWPNKGKVMAQFGKETGSDLKLPLSRALTRIWRRVKNGVRAVEILKIVPQDDFIYESIIAHKMGANDKHLKIRTVDELATCPAEDLRKICPNGVVYGKLKRYLKPYFPMWNPDIIFPGKLPAA